MRIVKRIAIIMVVLLLILVVVGFILPSKYQAERSITIKAPAETIFEQVNDLEKRVLWSPWEADDPDMEITFGKIKVGKGASYSWDGEKHGKGTLTITKSQPYSLIMTDLDFGEEGKAEGSVKFEDTGSAVIVTWSFNGDAGMNLMNRYFGAMMDYFVGPYFESGLLQLKELSEAAEPLTSK